MLSQDITNLAGCDKLDPLEPHILQLLLQSLQNPVVIDFPGLVALQLVVVVAVDEEELEDPALLLLLDFIVEEQDPAALPEDPKPPELRILLLQRFHLFRVLCIPKILNSLQMLGLHHQVSLLVMQLHQKHHQKLSLLCVHHTTHDHKSSHPRHHLSLQAHFE